MSLQFDEGTYTVSQQMDSIRLLAKEFALLHFLYENKDKAFTRSQLLDRVWPLEYPVERTVDDHIYRLRKKLKRWDEVSLDTVRGYGYRLALRENKSMLPSNPSVHDPEMQEVIHGLLRKYHLFGQGNSIQMLVHQQEALGLKISPYYQLYMHFIQGDLEWLTSTDDFPLEERLYWLLIYVHALIKPADSLELYRLAIQSPVLPAEYRQELRILNIIDIYAETGQYQEAKRLLEETYRVMEAEQLTYFKLPVGLAALSVELWGGSGEAAEKQLAVLRSELKDAPYLREIGRFQVMEGLWLLRQGRVREAELRMDDGLDVLKMSLNAPLYLNSAYQILLYIDHHRTPGRLRNKYQQIYTEIGKSYGVPVYGQQIVNTIINFLSTDSASSDLPLT
ncbi:winged helix-turn-helix domain-containing protein [Paenibacillus polysaccharolyticus]|uniref:winged helix-turn-helix domain-containing protein n=1 Tax=Paenibacillus polysaccharolyticus TaxID=582692 RepID=UPI00209F4FDA|nr:winged helix-turn-helix domain-containing protein [Paenibacillus polysaccharolyticus]MCP1137182.1 winged helix-turn-helix domain-containing protein [Paenibacillus polysaccharolyticus]